MAVFIVGDICRRYAIGIAAIDSAGHPHVDRALPGDWNRCASEGDRRPTGRSRKDRCRLRCAARDPGGGGIANRDSRRQIIGDRQIGETNVGGRIDGNSQPRVPASRNRSGRKRFYRHQIRSEDSYIGGGCP